MRQPLLPAGADHLAFFADRVHVGSQRQGHDIGLEAVDHRACLFARTAMRLLDHDGVAGLRLPVFGEGFVVFLVELAGGVVRHVQQLDIGCGGDGAGADGGRQREAGEKSSDHEADSSIRRAGGRRHRPPGCGQNATWKRVRMAFSSSRSPPAAPPSKLVAL
jgi:hypothetical protein